jgi:DNA-binding transcriptional regulator YiaG
MIGSDLKNWRKKWSITQVTLAEMLGTYQVTIARWETGARKIPFLLPLALEALENRMRKEQDHGIAGRVSGVQAAE